MICRRPRPEAKRCCDVVRNSKRDAARDCQIRVILAPIHTLPFTANSPTRLTDSSDFYLSFLQKPCCDVVRNSKRDAARDCQIRVILAPTYTLPTVHGKPSIHLTDCRYFYVSSLQSRGAIKTFPVCSRSFSVSEPTVPPCRLSWLPARARKVSSYLWPNWIKTRTVGVEQMSFRAAANFVDIGCSPYVGTEMSLCEVSKALGGSDITF